MKKNQKQIHPLTKFRTENRWKHKDIAGMLGVSLGYPVMIERGCRVSPDLAKKLSELCKCKKEIFLYPDDYKNVYDFSVPKK